MPTASPGEVVEVGTPGLAAVVEAFGPGILTADGALDRPALAAVIFSDPEARARLMRSSIRWSGSGPGRWSGPPRRTPSLSMTSRCSWRPARPPPTTWCWSWRPTRRPGCAGWWHGGCRRTDARSRGRAQASDDQRRAVADVVLDNSGTTGAVDRPGAAVLGRTRARSAARVRSGHGTTPEIHESPRWRDLGFRAGGRYWDRTSDLFRVREARYRCANRPPRRHAAGPRWRRDLNPCTRICRPLPRLSATPP